MGSDPLFGNPPPGPDLDLLEAAWGERTPSVFTSSVLGREGARVDELLGEAGVALQGRRRRAVVALGSTFRASP